MIRAALLLFLMTTSAEAGVVYRFTTKYTGDPLRKISSGTVSMSGRSYRLVLDPDPSNPRAWDVAVSNETSDGTETRFMNLENQTWYRERTYPPALETKLRGKVNTTQRTEGTETIDGRTVTRHFLRVEYRQTEKFGPTRVGSRVGVTLLLMVAPDLPPIPWQRHLVTGFPEADAEIARFMGTIDGMPLRAELASTRTYDGGGTPSTVLAVTTLTDILSEDIPPSRFEVPKNYREQEPVIGVPGVTTRH